MATIINTKLGESRGRKRVWLEGVKLSRQGYEPGMKFDLEQKGDGLQLTIKEDGKFTVSKRERNGRLYPIIDLTAQEVGEVFEGVEMLRVFIRNGSIEITAHHQQQRVTERVDRLVGKLQRGEQLSVCSLFHGGGVLDKAIHHGLEAGGLHSKVKIAVELEAKYLDTSVANNTELFDKGSIIIESAIQLVDLKKSPPQVEILLAGIPCTGASLAGRAKGKLKHAESHSDAGAMFFNFLQFVEAVNPACVVVENVENYINTASYEVICSVLSSWGYSMQERILDGNEFGALERRKRLCMVALSHGIEGFSLEDAKPVLQKENTINDILDDVPLDSDRWKSYDYLAEKELRDKKAGKGFARQLLTGAEAHCGVIGAGYAKSRSTEPFKIHPVDAGLSRLFTPGEHCRLKKIPEEVIHGLSDTVAHQVLGQSVIFPAFFAVAKHLAESLVRWGQPKQIEHEALQLVVTGNTVAPQLIAHSVI